MSEALPPPPDQLFGDLFRDVQLGHVFSDAKTFVDCVPKIAPANLVARYQAEKQTPAFDLRAFVYDYFVVPENTTNKFVSDTSLSVAEHIERLWPHLTCPADVPMEGSSRVPLLHPYVVPGGRFREIFYWDTYFTMLGLTHNVGLIRNIVDNFAYLIDRFGFVPNGNRTYFLSRTQPPFFALMVQLLAEIDGAKTLVRYFPQLRREYDFWMTGQEELSPQTPMVRRVVWLPGGRILNRYWNDVPTPRPEAYRAEFELERELEPLGIAPATLHRNLRAACESGWDYSSRWFRDEASIATIHTIDIVPVDLNCVLHCVETKLRDAARQSGASPAIGDAFDQLAKARERAIGQTFWNSETGFFHDYDAVANRRTDALTLAGVFPLFFNLATPEQARRVHDRLRADFLQPSGWVTTLRQTGQQWDWPNGWAPLQWIVYRGLMNYGFKETARAGRNRWLAHNEKVFKATGKMTEKYNVADAALKAGGGKYPNQDGFGWTNGVYLKLVNEQMS